MFLLCIALLGTALCFYAMETNHDHQNQQLISLTPEQRKNMARLCGSEILIDDIQKNIALHMIADFLVIPKTLQGHTDAIRSVAIRGNKMVTGADDSIKIWDTDTGLLHCTLQETMHYPHLLFPL